MAGGSKGKEGEQGREGRPSLALVEQPWGVIVENGGICRGRRRGETATLPPQYIIAGEGAQLPLHHGSASEILKIKVSLRIIPYPSRDHGGTTLLETQFFVKALAIRLGFQKCSVWMSPGAKKGHQLGPRWHISSCASVQP